MKRYGYFSINLPIEDVWERTLLFFENHKGKIEEQYVSTNNLYRKLKIRHGPSMHIYGTSVGETYEMIFGYNPSETVTHVSISVKYSNFGKGIPSKVPKEMVRDWASEMGIAYAKLIKEIDYNFINNINKIEEIPQHQIQDLNRIFCYACGEKNHNKSIYCMYCGTKLETHV